MFPTPVCLLVATRDGFRVNVKYSDTCRFHGFLAKCKCLAELARKPLRDPLKGFQRMSGSPSCMRVPLFLTSLQKRKLFRAESFQSVTIRRKYWLSEKGVLEGMG